MVYIVDKFDLEVKFRTID